MTEHFDLGDILSITTGRLVSLDGMAGVYRILNYMSGDNLYTHQLPRVSGEAAPVLLRWHPQLADVDASVVNPENHAEWLADQKARFGATLPVAPLSEDQHERIDPMSELVGMAHPSKIIVVTSGDAHD